jgi:hypothetical protein
MLPETRPVREVRPQPKRGDEDHYQGKLAEYAEKYGWVLCVGAGISTGVFPCWDELATTLVRQMLPRLTPQQIGAFLENQRPEALIQAAMNLSGGRGDQEVLEKLSVAFYARLRTKAGDAWKTIAKALTVSRPCRLSSSEWTLFLNFMSEFKSASASVLAEVIADALPTKVRPASIISFNAEPLLFALINCHYGRKEPQALQPGAPKILARLSHDLSRPYRETLPYYFVHGLLPVPDGRPSFNSSISPAKLVFSEVQYLELSRTAYSWHAATFLNACLNHKCVFIGLSFTDPNLRRWLAWEYAGRSRERHRKGLKDRPSHYWLLKRPHKKMERQSDRQQLLLKSVEHLGVRIRWLDDWPEIGPALREMLGFS